jgi:hypothetical protein
MEQEAGLNAWCRTPLTCGKPRQVIMLKRFYGKA